MEQSISIVKEELGLESSSHKYLKGFSMFRHLDPRVVETYQSMSAPLQITVSVVEYMSSYPLPRDDNSGLNYYLFGVIELKKKFPKTYICKERIPEKIFDLITRMETDFPEHRKFSRNFHVLTLDSDQLRDLFRPKDLAQLTAFPDMEVEIHENSCLFRHSRCAVSLKEAERFSELAKSLVEILL